MREIRGLQHNGEEGHAGEVGHQVKAVMGLTSPLRGEGDLLMTF